MDYEEFEDILRALRVSMDDLDYGMAKVAIDKYVKLRGRDNAFHTEQLKAYFAKHPGRVDQIRDGALANMAESNNIEGAFILLDNGFNPNINNRCGMSPLALTALYDTYDIAVLLLKYCADVNNPGTGSPNAPIFWAVMFDRPKFVKLFLECGADINIKGFNGFTPLIVASIGGYENMVRFLLEHGADPSIRDRNGRTAIQWAIQRKHPEIVRIILEHIRRNGEV